VAATRAVEQAIGHLANAWSLRRWRGQQDRLRDDFRPPARRCASVAGGSGPHLKDHHDTRKDLNSPGIPVGESVEMRADYLRPRLDLLRARLEPGERILAQGRAFEPNSHCDSFELSQLISGPGCAVIVTGQRVLWVSPTTNGGCGSSPSPWCGPTQSAPRRIAMRWPSTTRL